jgi:signal peptidase II
MKQRVTFAILVLSGIVGLDIITKQWALDALGHGHSVPGFGGFVPYTLAYNQGVAFGLPLPSAGRWLIIAATLVVLWVLGGLFVRAERTDWLRLGSVVLVASGAVGNLIDRVRWDRGVVDFIGPIDLGFMYWPIFNVADMAITTGAILLGISLWQEGAHAPGHAAAPAAPAGETGG